MTLKAVPKPPRPVRDATYLLWIRGQACCVCEALDETQESRTEAHHVVTRGAGGGDDTAVPCCRRHHTMFHVLGRKTFARKTGLDLLLVAGIYRREYQERWAA